MHGNVPSNRLIANVSAALYGSHHHFVTDVLKLFQCHRATSEICCVSEKIYSARCNEPGRATVQAFVTPEFRIGAIDMKVSRQGAK